MGEKGKGGMAVTGTGQECARDRFDLAIAQVRGEHGFLPGPSVLQGKDASCTFQQTDEGD